ncbi:MAG TPA: ABC transporter substrate-binding protein [Ilumatobacter sp.]|nr:ABC transporter substrate-binding protein [Ilumatobacter sp.]
MNTRRTRHIAVVIALAALVTACGSDDDTAQPAVTGDQTTIPTAQSTVATNQPTDDGGGYPVTIESCGTDYTFDSPPQRVVLGWPQSYETLDALGVGDSVVGYFSGSLSSLPANAPDIAEISPDFAPSREAMASVQADLVILNDLTSVAGDAGAVSLDDLRASGTNVFVLGDYCGYDTPAPTTIDMVTQDITDLGAIFGIADRAHDLIDEIDDRLANAPVGNQMTTAFVQVYDGTLYALSGSNYAAALGAADLDNAFADLDGNFSEISAEEVLTLTPDVIVVVYSKASTDADTAIAEIRDLLANSPAVTNNRIAAIDDSAISAGGVTLVDVVEQIGTAITQ